MHMEKEYTGDRLPIQQKHWPRINKANYNSVRINTLINYMFIFTILTLTFIIVMSLY